MHTKIVLQQHPLHIRTIIRLMLLTFLKGIFSWLILAVAFGISFFSNYIESSDSISVKNGKQLLFGVVCIYLIISIVFGIKMFFVKDNNQNPKEYWNKYFIFRFMAVITAISVSIFHCFFLIYIATLIVAIQSMTYYRLLIREIFVISPTAPWLLDIIKYPEPRNRIDSNDSSKLEQQAWTHYVDSIQNKNPISKTWNMLVQHENIQKWLLMQKKDLQWVLCVEAASLQFELAQKLYADMITQSKNTVQPLDYDMVS